MQPVLNYGGLIIVRRVRAESIGVGDVTAFKGNNILGGILLPLSDGGVLNLIASVSLKPIL